jgi:hypothetical protein
MSDDLLTRLRAQRDWDNAIREAESSRDLEGIVGLLRSGTLLGEWSRELLADLFDAHRLVRKKRGAWKSMFEPSAQAKYADAAGAVRRLEKMKRDWEKVKGAEWAKGMTLTLINGDRLGDIGDPVNYVAKRFGLDAEKLWNVAHGRTGFGRGREPKPDSFATNWGYLRRFSRPSNFDIFVLTSDNEDRGREGDPANARVTEAPARQTASRRRR